MNLPNQTPPENNQDAFNRVWQWMTRPGAAKAMHANEQCSYLTEQGNACGVGCLLPGAIATWADAFGGGDDGDTGIRTLTELQGEAAAPLREWLSSVSVSLLCHVQSIHDNEPVDLWPEHLRGAAARLNLTVPA